MQRLWLCLWVPLILLAQRPPRPASQPSSPPVQIKPEDLCTVEGQVSNAMTGAPLGKAAVTLRRADATPNVAGAARSYSATSDPSGRFVITGIVPGKYRLSATRTGFVDADYGARDYLQAGATFSLDAGKHMNGANFRMIPNGVITGRVLDEDGEPMASLQVQALRFRYTQGIKRLVAYGSGGTNDIGEYRISGLPPGRYLIHMSPHRSSRTAAPQPDEEYVPMYHPGTTDPAAAVQFDIAPGGQLRAADFTLSKRHTVQVKGHVTNTSGIGGRYLMVYLMPRGLAEYSSMNRPSVIEPNGNFELRGVPSGSYTLLATARERDKSITARLPVEVGQNSIENLSVTIHPQVNLSGWVRLEGQAAASLSTVQVALRARDPMFASNPSARVQEDGSFTLANVNPDLYNAAVSGLPDGFYLKAVLLGGQDALAPGLDLSHGGAGGLELVLAPNAGQAAGVVQNNQGQPASGATVVLIPQEPERSGQVQYYKTAITDAAGTFALKNLDPGQYKVFAWQGVESDAYPDPDFMRPLENRGVDLTIKEGSQETLQLKVIG